LAEVVVAVRLTKARLREVVRSPVLPFKVTPVGAVLQELAHTAAVVVVLLEQLVELVRLLA
jgi:hypothetical protein